MLSGNRNFEGRINQDVKANYLASPPLVVAYALAGRMDIDLANEPLGEGIRRRAGLPARHLARRRGDQGGRRRLGRLGDVHPQLRRGLLRRRGTGTRSRSPRATATPGPTRPTCGSRASSSGCRPTRPGSSRSPAPGRWPCSATRSPPTTSRRPGRSKKRARPGEWLMEQGVEPGDFNSYGSRRGNHEVMIRGTFANIRLRNQLVERAGGFTRHFPDGEETTIYEAAMSYAGGRRAAGRAGRQGVRLRLLARLGGEGDEAARRPRRDRRELRAHPPLQPDRDGRAAAAVRRRRERRARWA